MAKPQSGDASRKPKQLLVSCDPEVYASIKTQAAKENTSMRAIVMRALQAVGFPVPPADLEDKRK